MTKKTIAKTILAGLLTVGLTSNAIAFDCTLFEDIEATEIEMAAWWINQNQDNEQRILLVGKLQKPPLGAVQDRPEAIKDAQVIIEREKKSQWGAHVTHIDDAYLFVGHSVDKKGIKTPIQQLNAHHASCEIEKMTDCYGYLPYDMDVMFFSDAKTIASGQFIAADDCPSFIFNPSEFLMGLYINGMKIRPRHISMPSP